MKTKTAVIVLACIMLAAFVLGAVGAVRLPDGDTEKADDRLAGVLLSEYSFSELFGELKQAYAERDGDAIDAQFRFPCAPGATAMNCFAAVIDDTVVWYGDEAILAERGYTVRDQTAWEISIDAHMYLSPDFDGAFIYAHKVYQTHSGDIYAVAGQGYGCPTDGSTASFEVNETVHDVKNGEETEQITNVKVELCCPAVPVRVSLLQYDSEGSLLAAAEYTPDELPGELAAERNAEFMVIETESENAVGEKEMSRSVIGKTEADKGVHVFADRGDGICIRKSYVVDWGQ